MTAARDLPRRYSPPMGLCCPYCHEPFVGTVECRTGRFVHELGDRAGADATRLDALAEGSWFWARFRDRIFGSH